jgi:hypothetical protein
VTALEGDRGRRYRRRACISTCFQQAGPAGRGAATSCAPCRQRVKAAAAKLGFDPATFGGHSLRSGLVTTAVKRGVNLMKVCDQTGHKSLEMLRVYSRDAELFAGNAPAGLL